MKNDWKYQCTILIAIFGLTLQPASFYHLFAEEAANEEGMEIEIEDDFADTIAAMVDEEDGQAGSASTSGAPAAEENLSEAATEPDNQASGVTEIEEVGEDGNSVYAEGPTDTSSAEDSANLDAVGVTTAGTVEPEALSEEGVPMAEGIPADGIAPTPDVAVPGVDGAISDTAAPPLRRAHDFEGEDLNLVLRGLARQAKINMVVSPQVTGLVSMRLENVTPLEAIQTIVKANQLILDQDATGTYYVKTQAEKQQEPAESAYYTFSYARAEEVIELLQAQLQSGATPVVDQRTNTIFYRETQSNLESIRNFLGIIDRPTKQVMIEARLVETAAAPQQDYGISWAGALRSKTFSYGGSPVASQIQSTTIDRIRDANGDGIPDRDSGGELLIDSIPVIQETFENVESLGTGNFFGEGPSPIDLIADNAAGGFSAFLGQLAILTAPQLSLTLDLINQDDDSELLSNPRIVTADNEEAVIRIIRNQPVPNLTFNEQTASAVFSGFEDKEFGNTLKVLPQINKDDFVTLRIQPEISNKVGDEEFIFAGSLVRSPVIDTRSLQAKVLIRSGDTLAIGGLMQDETQKQTTKVPILGDIPVVGYLFKHVSAVRAKRNLLIFVTPTIIDERYYTGLEDQVNGFNNEKEVYADPKGWRNNAKGVIRLVPTSKEHIATELPPPGLPSSRAHPPHRPSGDINYKTSASPREL